MRSGTAPPPPDWEDYDAAFVAEGFHLILRDSFSGWLVAYVLRKYVSGGGGGGGGGEEGAAGGAGGGGGGGWGGDCRHWGAAAFSPAIFPGPYPARSTLVRMLLAWTSAAADAAGHRQLTDALAAHRRAWRAGLLLPEEADS